MIVMRQIYNIQKGCIVLCYLFLVHILGGCIKNDIPYPYIPADILEIAFSGQLEQPEINVENKTIKVKLSDTVNIKRVRIEAMRVTNEAIIIPDKELCVNPDRFPSTSFTQNDLQIKDLNSYVNLSEPFDMTLLIYQNYLWQIHAKQIIHRELLITNQIGEAIFDVKNHNILVYVAKHQSLEAIEIKKINLGVANAEIAPNPYEITDFRQPCRFTVTAFGEQEEWTLSVVPATVMVTTGEPDVWAKFAHVKGERLESDNNEAGFEYKMKGASDWSKIVAEDIKGGVFRAKISGLIPETKYLFRAYSGKEYGNEITFTTEATPPVANLNFEIWTQHGKNWYPNADAANSFWASGNEGVTMSLVGKAPNTIPVEDGYQGKAAKLTTITVPFANLAAGNIFTGTYKTNISSPKLSAQFGRPYTGRPTALTGWYKYRTTPINVGKPPLGEINDLCHVYVWLKDAKGKEVAYGEFSNDKTVTSFTPFTIKINYSNPTSPVVEMAIVATSSKYGGDFIGGEGSELIVDEFELLFD